jgi:hypothetical protein
VIALLNCDFHVFIKILDDHYKLVSLCRYGTVMGGLLSEKFLDTNISIPFSGPPLNTPSLNKYKQVSTLNVVQVVKMTLLLIATPIDQGAKTPQNNAHNAINCILRFAVRAETKSIERYLQETKASNYCTPVCFVTLPIIGSN